MQFALHNCALKRIPVRLMALFALILGIQALPAYAACEAGKPTQKPNSQYVVKGATVYDTKAAWLPRLQGENPPVA